MLWRTVSIGLFVLLALGTFWLEQRMGWPKEITTPLVAVPYWAVVTAVWRHYGPEMPGL
ncbi:hypothetical protein ACFQY4_20355 [Catellatospora bangladeshensis]|uniref:hypothetical protein n=1 Tax=Catellatospora bangladeshensis TaxID=310355 RepID=UPI0036143C70